jgi:ABC-type transport system substrate-binding protein
MKKTIILIIFILLCTFNVQAENRYGGTIVFGKAADPVTMDPAHATDGETFNATVQVYDRLVQFKYGSTDIEPALAERWDISKDALKYTFYLRKGVKFHKTSYFKEEAEFTADDVVFSIKRQFDSENPYYRVGGPFAYWLSMDMNNIVKDVIKEDNYTVVILLKKPDATFLSNMAMDFMSILSKKYADYLYKQKRMGEIDRKPIGTGPFIFNRWIKDDRLIFDANKEYWGGRPFVDKLIMKVIPSNSVRAAELKTGQIHIMDLPSYEELNNLKNDKNIKLMQQEGLNVAYLAFNMEKKPFDNPLVRKAIYMAINRKGIIDSVYSGYGVVAKNPIPPVMWGYNDKIDEYKYDPVQAKKLLEQAGFEKGFKTTLWTMSAARPYLPSGRKVAEIIQADLKKIGIDVDIISYDWTTFLEKTYYGEHEMALMGWTGDNGDPDNFLYVLLSSKAADKPAQNIAFYRNKAFDDLLEQAKIITDRGERAKLYYKAQEIFHNDTPWVPLAHSVVVVPVRKNVMDFKIDPVGSRRFYKVWLKRD